MFKKLATVLALVAMLTLAFAPAALAAVTWREGGTLECYPGSTTATTVVTAKGDHQHKVGSFTWPKDLPDDGNWHQTNVNWTGVYLAGYSLYNQTNRDYSYLSSYGHCT